jgi:predicted dehydrogenase
MRNLAENPRVDLVAACDRDESVRQRISNKYPAIVLYDSIEEMLTQEPGLDALIISTPAGFHFSHAQVALSAGKHVFVEKPMACSVREALELVETAKRVNRKLMVGHTFLYNNIVHEVKNRIDSGELGDVHYAYSQRLNLGQFRKDTDVLWTLAPHDISVLNYWFDSRPQQVSARGITCIAKESNVAEVCFAQLDYPAGQSVQLHLSWLDPQKIRQMVLVGSKKMLIYDDVNVDRHIQIYDKRVEREYRKPTDDFADFTTRLRAGDLTIPNVRLVEPLAKEIEHFVECVLADKNACTDGIHGLEVVAVLEAMSQSMSQGGIPMPVRYPSELSSFQAAQG